MSFEIIRITYKINEIHLLFLENIQIFCSFKNRALLFPNNFIGQRRLHAMAVTTVIRFQRSRLWYRCIILLYGSYLPTWVPKAGNLCISWLDRLNILIYTILLYVLLMCWRRGSCSRITSVPAAGQASSYNRGIMVIIIKIIIPTREV